MKVIVRLVVLVVALTLIPPLCWPLEINTNFSHYYLPLAVLALLLFARIEIAKRRLFRLAACLVLIAFIVRSIFVLLPFYQAPEQQPAITNGLQIKIVVANLHQPNHQFSDLNTLLQNEKPDLVGLLEFGSEARDKLNLAQSYPYFLGEVREDAFGIGLYSKYPLGGFKLTQLGFPTLPPIVASSIELPGATIGFFLVHTFPPVAQRNIDRSYLLLRRMSTIVRHSQGALFFAGDFNFTPFSVRYDKFMEWTELKNAAWGRGLSWSWNALSWWLRFRLDHIFYRGEMELLRNELIEFDQSDHRLQLIEIKLGLGTPPFSPPATTLLALDEKE